MKKILLSLAAAVMAVSVGAKELPKNVVVYEGDKGPGKGKHIVFIASDHEYRAEETCPMMARILAKHYGFKCSVIFGVNKDGFVEPGSSIIPGTFLLEDADLLFLFARFLNPTDELMKPIEDYIQRGGPIVGLRTSTHAFKNDNKGTYAKYDWKSKVEGYRGGFGRVILGEGWAGHYGPNHKSSTRLDIVEENKDHPILKGVEDMWYSAGAYQARPVKGSVVLAMSQPLATMDPASEPMKGKKPTAGMWVRTYTSEAGKEGRAFCVTQGTSEGIVNDGLRRALVNASLWAMGMEDKIVADSNIDLVGGFKPKKFNFNGQSKGLDPQSVAGWDAPIFAK